jgi:hypothetical protein
MTDETITLEFLAGRVERVLEEIARMRGDLCVMTGMIHRLDGTVQVLANEVIEHACLEPQVRNSGTSNDQVQQSPRTRGRAQERRTAQVQSPDGPAQVDADTA